MFIKLFLLVIVLLAICLAALGISILVRKGGKFPNTHISGNHELEKRGITCARHTDVGCNPISESGCSTCHTGLFGN